MKDKKRAGLVICLVVFAAAMISLIISAVNSAHGRQLNSELQQAAQSQTAVSVPQPAASPPAIDLAALRAEYPDIYAYIEIPNTVVSYPVFQHPTDASYYLNHNADGTTGRPAVIYSEPGTARDFSDFNTILYGHDMNDRTMFGTLQDYRDPNYLARHRALVIYTPNETLHYTIYGAVVFDDRYLPYFFDQKTEAGRQAYIDAIAAANTDGSQLLDDVAITTESRIITLSTCVDGQPSQRYLVLAVQTDE